MNSKKTHQKKKWPSTRIFLLFSMKIKEKLVVIIARKKKQNLFTQPHTCVTSTKSHRKTLKFIASNNFETTTWNFCASCDGQQPDSHPKKKNAQLLMGAHLEISNAGRGRQHQKKISTFLPFLFFAITSHQVSLPIPPWKKKKKRGSTTAVIERPTYFYVSLFLRNQKKKKNNRKKKGGEWVTKGDGPEYFRLWLPIFFFFSRGLKQGG